MAVRTIPFDAGQEQGVDKALLSGRFSLVRNGVLSRDGQLRPRPAFTALPVTAYGTGSFVAYDLASYNDRLLALGDVMGLGYPTDIAEYVEGGAAAWRPSVPSPTVPRLPRATLLRDLPQPPDQQEGTNSFTSSAFSHYSCLTWSNLDGSSASFVHIVDTSTGQTILFEQVAARQLQSVEIDDRFVICGITNTQLKCWSFRPALDESLVVVSAALTTATNIYQRFSMTRVVGSAQFVTVTSETVTGNITTRRWSNAGVLQVPSGGQYTQVAPSTATALDVIANATGNNIVVAATVNAHLTFYIYNLSVGGATTAGPVSPFGADDNQEGCVVYDSNTTIWALASDTSGTETRIGMRPYNVATLAFTAAAGFLRNVKLASSAVFSSPHLIFAVRNGTLVTSQSNMLVAVKPSEPNSVTPLASKDFEVSTSQSTVLPELTLVASTGLLYWPNASLSVDLQANPRVTEVSISSTERRQMCQVGNLVLIGGGMPCVYDGAQLFECGFLARPVIVSVTPSNGAGALSPLATYIYKVTWEWLDSDDTLWRSAISTNTTVVMAALQDTNTVVAQAPLSMRSNNGAGPSGSTVRVKLFRTVSIVDSQPAVITGTLPADPPSSSLNGQFMGIFINDSIGASLLNVAFGPADTTLAQVVITINAVTTGRVIASNVAGALRLTSVQTGETIALNSGFGVSETVFGMQTTTAFGTTEITTGDVFHLAASEYTTLGGDVGQYVTLVDVMSDDDLREQQVVYTQAENPLDHHGPGPADLCSSGGDTASVSGQPKRDRWTVSKPFATSQGIQFANPGREKFSRRIRGDIEAIAQRDEETILFTRREIWAVNGAGPDRAGKGDFQLTRLIYGEGGMQRLGWRSMLTVSEGTFFQLDKDKIYTLAGGGEPTWIGHPVVETLALYPVVVAVCHVKQLQTLAFACQSVDGLSGVLLRYDLRRQQWFEDDIGPIDALAEYDGRLAIVVAGVVYLQDAVFGNGTTPTLTARLGSFTNFGSLGWGAIVMFTVLGQYRGPCTVEMQISYDDTVTWTTCGTYTLDGTSYVTGQPIELEFTPAIQECARFAIQVISTPTQTNSGAAWLNACDVHDDPDAGPARKGQAFTR